MNVGDRSVTVRAVRDDDGSERQAGITVYIIGRRGEDYVVSFVSGGTAVVTKEDLR